MKTYKLSQNQENEVFFILNENDFETTNLCECFDNNGQKNGCYDAECYCLDNSNSGFKEDLESYIKENFDINFDVDAWDFDSVYPLEDEKNIKISIAIKKWISDNENHVEVIAKNYHDGRNWKTLILQDDNDNVDIEELSEEQNNEIINLYNSSLEWSEWSYGRRYANTEKYQFAQSQWQGSFEIASVEYR